MLFVVTVTETCETTYTVEAPDEKKAMEAFYRWADDNVGTIARDLNNNCLGWDYSIAVDGNEE